MICKIKTDIGCRVYIDDVLKGVAEAGIIFMLHLEKGQYFVRYESLYDSEDCIERGLTIVDSDIIEYAYLLPILDRRKMCLYPFKNASGLWGYKELFSDKELIAPQYSEARGFSDDHKYARVKKQLWGVIDYSGNIIIPFEFDKIDILENDWFILKREEHSHLFNSATKEESCAFNSWKYLQIPQQPYSREIEYKDDKDTIVFSCDFSSEYFYLDGTPAGDATKVFSLSSGRVELESEGRISPYLRTDGLIEEHTNGMTNLYDKGYNLVLGYRCVKIGPFKDGIARVERIQDHKSLYGLVNRKGDGILPCIYDSIDEFYEGVACAKKNKGHYGYVDKEGHEIIPFVYRQANRFSDGIAAVCRDGFEVFINIKGEELFTKPEGSIILSRCIYGLIRFRKWATPQKHGFINKNNLPKIITKN